MTASKLTADQKPEGIYSSAWAIIAAETAAREKKTKKLRALRLAHPVPEASKRKPGKRTVVDDADGAAIARIQPRRAKYWQFWRTMSRPLRPSMPTGSIPVNRAGTRYCLELEEEIQKRAP